MGRSLAILSPACTLPLGTRPAATRRSEARLLRPRAFDDLGLKRALGDRILPLLVAAMAFLAALSFGAALGSASLAGRWQGGAAAALTVQVPRATDQGLLNQVLATLRANPGVGQARVLAQEELTALLRPWLGSVGNGLALPLPAVIEVHLNKPPPDLATLARELEAIAPGTLTESHGVWVQRLAVLARSLQACAWLAVILVSAVAAAVVMVATRAGLAARRDAIEIVHGLGATDGYIAGRFASRATRLAAIGGFCGALAALPVLLTLADLASPFVHGNAAPAMILEALPLELWLTVPGLPLAAAMVGFITAQMTVRRWLRHLP